ncbi:MAG: metalloregulator ArsR/SmtB family transcription factor [Planctomycetes bacterium]|nr:metalloregulator ArsR/SmtB family transcription factor [Planctomycetota bacterium]
MIETSGCCDKQPALAPALATLQSTLKLLSDPVRLRLCALLARSELAVQELVAITGLQQSRISNHLSLLKRSGLVRDRREGTWSFHSLVEPDEQGPLPPALFGVTVRPWLESPEGRPDAQALAAVIDQRRVKSRAAHDELAEHWAALGQEWALGTLRAEALALAWPCGADVADLGCGTGFLADWLAARGARVIAVDHSERMLAAARGRSGPGITFRRGRLDALPLGDGEVDAAFANLVFHHVPDLDAAAREVFRVLRPAGVAVVSDLLPHRADWMREAMGDLRLGLDPELLVGALARAGFVELRREAAADRYRVAPPGGEPAEFPMFLVRGQRP